MKNKLTVEKIFSLAVQAYTELFTNNLESAYKEIYKRYLSGKNPSNLEIKNTST